MVAYGCHLCSWPDPMNTTHVPKSLFKARALEYLRQVETTGESLIITNHGQPAVEVRPWRADTRGPLERLRGSVLRYDTPLEPVADQSWDALR